MLAFHASARRKIRRAAGDEIEFLIGMNNSLRTKITCADFVAIFNSVVVCRFSGEHHAFTLRLDGHKFRAGQTPRANHADRADAATEVERGACGWTPSRAIPRGQNIVGGKAMAVAQLEQAEMSADGV